MSTRQLEVGSRCLKRAPVFVVGCPKSGTTLLTALLEGHPSLLVFPAEIKYFRHTDHFTLFPEKKICWEPRLQSIATRIINGRFFERILGGDSPTPSAGEIEPPDFSAIDAKRFRSHFADLRHVQTHRELFLRFFEAFLVSIGSKGDDLSNYHIVEKTPRQEEYALLLKQWFPNAKFVHIVRNPYATLCSLRLRAASRFSYPYLRSLVKWIEFSDYFRQRNQYLIEEYFVLRFEDLVTDPEHTMRSLCSFIGIQFRESLLHPTILGNSWGGNSMYGQSFSAIDTSPLENWKQIITDFEIALINQRMSRMLEAFEYARLPPSAARVYMPHVKEWLVTYVANRALLLRGHYVPMSLGHLFSVVYRRVVRRGMSKLKARRRPTRQKNQTMK